MRVNDTEIDRDEIFNIFSQEINIYLIENEYSLDEMNMQLDMLAASMENCISEVSNTEDDFIKFYDSLEDVGDLLDFEVFFHDSIPEKFFVDNCFNLHGIYGQNLIFSRLVLSMLVLWTLIDSVNDDFINYSEEVIRLNIRRLFHSMKNTYEENKK